MGQVCPHTLSRLRRGLSGLNSSFLYTRSSISFSATTRCTYGRMVNVDCPEQVGESVTQRLLILDLQSFPVPGAQLKAALLPVDTLHLHGAVSYGRSLHHTHLVRSDIAACRFPRCHSKLSPSTPGFARIARFGKVLP